MSFSRACSCPTHLFKLNWSTMRFMNCLGVWRSCTLSPRASRSRSRCRIFSRSTETAFMRRVRSLRASSGMASVITVAIAAMAANTLAIIFGSWSFSIRNSTMPPRLKIEIDHLLHHEDADHHPHRAACHHQASGLMRPQQLDVTWARDIDEDHDGKRQRRDNDGGSLCLHRHRLDLGLHLLAVAQHARQVAERF